MNDYRKILDSNRRIGIWGAGQCFIKNADCLIKYLKISYICDRNIARTGENSFNGIPYVTPDEINSKEDFIILVAENKEIISSIKAEIERHNIEYCMVEDALNFCEIKKEEEIAEKRKEELSYDDTLWNNVMMKYIGIHVPSKICNLRCPYCYVRQVTDFTLNSILPHSPKYIRLMLSQKRLGGQCLIGLCGEGETLLCDKIIEICVELLKEGHYLHIVTNGTVTEKIHELVETAGKYVNHIFFKFSFHYAEFERRKLLEQFAENVAYVENAGASYTIELTTDDGLIDRIEEIKEFALTHFGALPQVTIARDDTKPEKPIYTNLSYEEYYKVWSNFHSELFEVKWEYYGKHINNCNAGEDALYIDLLSGSITKCLAQCAVDNLYTSSKEKLEYDRIGDECKLPYCYNNHAYLTLGISPTVNTVSFAKVRDREKIDGNHWLTQEMYNFINQKLYINSGRGIGE